MHRVACKQTHDQKRQVGLGEYQSPAQPADHHRHYGVEPHVRCVVPARLQPVESVIGAEAEDRERSIRLVAHVGAHGLAPEVVGEGAGEGCSGTHVGVVTNGEYVIVHEAALQAVPVAGHGQSCGDDSTSRV